MSPARAEARFAELRTKWRAAHAERCRWQGFLTFAHGDVAFASAPGRRRLDRLRAAEDRAAQRFYAHLTAISPRRWDTGVGVHWTLTELTFTDAVTAGQLTVTPPPAYGATREQLAQFAAPVDTAGLSGR